MKLLQLAGLAVWSVLCLNTAYSQEIHSGFLTVQGNGEEASALKIHADNLTLQNAKDIAADFGLYRDILSTEFEVENHKIFVKFQSPMTANMVLGILERRAIHAYYLDSSNNPVSYTKTGQEVFLR